jgi:hypothetical protein
MMSKRARSAARATTTVSLASMISTCVVHHAVGWSQVQEPTGQVDQ